MKDNKKSLTNTILMLWMCSIFLLLRGLLKNLTTHPYFSSTLMLDKCLGEGFFYIFLDGNVHILDLIFDWRVEIHYFLAKANDGWL